MSDIELNKLGSTIKQAYEEQTNTNAYTNVDKQKVANIDTELAAKEDNLGNPDVDDKVLASKADGTRFWKHDDIAHLPMGGDISGTTAASTVESVGGQTASDIADVVATQVPDLQTDVNSLKLGSDKLVLNGDTKAEAKENGVEVTGELKINQSGQDKALVFIESENDEEFFSIKNRNSKVWLSGHNGRDVEIIVYDPTNVMPSAAIKCTFDDVQLFLPLKVKYGGIDVNDNKITNLKTPTEDTDAATKAYVDANAAGGSGRQLINEDGKVVVDSTSDGADLLASNGNTMLKANLGGIEILEHFKLKASQYGNALEICEGEVKYLILKFDQLKNPTWTTNYGRGFIFRIDETTDNLPSENFSPFSIFKSAVTSNAPHLFNDGIEMNNTRIKGLPIATDDDEPITKVYLDGELNSLDEKLDLKEDYLGKPTSDNMVLCSNLVGTRFWMDKDLENYPMSGDVTGTTDAAVVQSVGGKTAQEIADAVDHLEGGSELKDQAGIVRVQADDLGMKVTGSTRALIANYATLISAKTEVAEQEIETFKINPATDKTTYLTKNTAPHIFSIHDGANAEEVTIIGLNGTIHLKRQQFSGGASMFGNQLESLGNPIASDDATTKSYVDNAIANGGGNGAPEKIVDANGDAKIETISTGIYVNGSTIMRQEAEQYVLQFRNTTTNKSYMTMVEYADKLKMRMKGGKGFSFQVYGDEDNFKTVWEAGYNVDYFSIFQKTLFKESLEIRKEADSTFLEVKDESGANSVLKMEYETSKLNFITPKDFVFSRDNTTLLTLGADSANFQKKVNANGGLSSSNAKFSYVEVENPLGGDFLKLGDGNVENFVFSTRSNQNKIIQPSDYICNFMFDENGTQTNSLTIAKGLCLADTDFQFNSYVSFKQEIDLTNKRIKNVQSPTSLTDAANKSYVDNARSAAVATSLENLEAVRKAEEYNVLGSAYKAYFSAVRTGNLWNCTLHLPKADHSSSNTFLYGTVIPDGWRPQETITQIVDSGSENIKAYISSNGMASVNYSDYEGNVINRDNTKTSFSVSWVIPN